MGATAFILVAGDSSWRLCAFTAGTATITDVSFEANATTADRAASIAASLAGLGYSGQGTLLAIPSTWCFAASISTDGLPKGDRKAMLYRLEEKLPLPAEGLVADFVPTARAESNALGIAAAAEALREWVDALEAAGVAVQSIAPAALLAAQRIVGDDRNAMSLLLAEPSPEAKQVSVITLDGGAPVAWALVPADPSDLKLQLDLSSLDSERAPQWVAYGLEDRLLESLIDAMGASVTKGDGSLDALVASTGAEVLCGRVRPWAELRRGPLAIEDRLRLHRKPLNALLAAAAVALLAFAAVMIFRGVRYGHAADADERQLADAFRQQFPGWALPAGVRAVVESEHRKAAARTGGSLPPEARRSALATLRDVLEKLPGDRRFTVDRATFDDAGFEMEGRLRAYEDLDAIANAARASGLIVDPPQARKDSAGYWSFTIRGTRASRAEGPVANGAAER